MKGSLASAVLVVALLPAPGAAAERADGARNVAISGLRGSLQNPCFAPDSARLAFTQWKRGYNEGSADVHAVDLSGGRPTRVSRPGAASVNLPGTCWNAALDRIVYSSDPVGADAIWTARPDGGDRQRVFGRRRLISIEPSFSPDGQWVVFESSVFDAEGPGTIWKVRIDGTGLSRLTRRHNDRQPNWSPRGDRIVFQRERGGDSFDLMTIDPDGGGLRNVTRTRRVSETDVSWAPDGERLVFSSDGRGIRFASLFTIRADGTERRRLTMARGWYDGAPSWSPDGATIAFEARRGEPDGSPGTRIWTIAAPG
jgi:TolB protein